MEPMLLFALGFVIYGVYLTAKDLLADLRKEGLLRRPVPGRALWIIWKSNLMRSFTRERKRHPARLAGNSFILVPCRSEVVHSRAQHSLESRLYQLRQ